MGGVLCVFDPSGIEQEPSRYLTALRRMTHRGAHVDAAYLGALAFVGRCSRPATDRDDGDRTSLASPDGRVALAFDGRLANRRELDGSPGSSHGKQATRSDAARVLDAYLVHGDACFERLEGVWALALWDARSEELHLSRDRLGVRPLYYHQRRRLVAASEIKCILALEPRTREPNLERLSRYLADGLIDDWTDTFFRDVRPVPPGTVLTASRAGLRRMRFWSLAPWAGDDHRSKPIIELLDEAIDRTTPADAEVGLALSGGIDSSLIAGLLTGGRRARRPQARAFSIVPPHTPDESRLIDATVRHTGIAHRYVPMDRLDWPSLVDAMLDAHDEPVQAAGNVYQLALRRAIAEAGCSSVVVGYGADEIFAGYGLLGLPFLISLVRAGRLSDALRFLPGAPFLLGERPLEAAVRILAREVRGLRGRFWRRGTKAAAGGPSWFRGLQARGGTPVTDILALTDEPTPSEPPAVAWPPPLPAPGREFYEALLGCFRAHIALLVRIEDRNANAHGLELCAPFMDVALVDAALSFPFHEYMKGGANKALLRSAAAGLLAPEVLSERRKFFTPGNDAYVVFDLLRPELLRMLDSPSFGSSGFWTSNCKQRYLADSRRRARGAVWLRVYMVQRWYDRIVASGAGSPR